MPSVFTGYTPMGLQPESFKNVQLGAGMFVVNLDVSAIEADPATHKTTTTAAEFASILDAAVAAGKSLGATTGGGTFNAVPQMEQIPVDGMTYPIVGSTVAYSWEVTLGTTIKEITPENLSLVLPMAETDEATGGITASSTLLPSHYIPSVGWCGRLIDGRLAYIELLNALNIEGMAMKINDRGGAEIPVNFRAHQADMTKMQTAPFRIIFFPMTGQEPAPGP